MKGRAAAVRWLATAAPAFFVAAALLAACPAPAPDDDPVAAYRRFYAAAADGDWDTMLQMLEPRTRACLQQAADRLAKKMGAQEEPMSFYLRQMRAERITPLREVKLLQRDAERTILEVRAGPCDKPDTCKTSQVNMMRGPQGWQVQARPSQPVLLNQGKSECEI